MLRATILLRLRQHQRLSNFFLEKKIKIRENRIRIWASKRSQIKKKLSTTKL